MHVLAFTLLLLAAVQDGQAAFPEIRSLGSTEMTWAAFAQVLHNKVTDTEDLVVSTFNPLPFTKDNVYTVKDIKLQLNRPEGGNDLKKLVLTNELPWPNEFEEVPGDVFGRDDIWWGAVGFLVPTKDNGNVCLLEVSETLPATVYDISTQPLQQEKWWYHRVDWHDMNNDGRKDALSARAYLDADGNAVTEMVWFEQPASDYLNNRWTEHVLFSGPDALWRFEQMTVGGNTYDVIISTQYFAEKLVLSWIEPDGSWERPETIQHLVVDDVVEERYFDCQLVDLNVDGKKDLLVSINSDKNGKLVAYEIPDDFRTGNWIRHGLAEGFKPQGIIITEGNGAPGSTQAFYPMDPSKDGRLKPMIMLTGDDDGNVYMFESDDDMDPSNWSYTYQSFFYASGTVGSPAIKDVDHDGYAEVFVPAYSDGSLTVFTFKP